MTWLKKPFHCRSVSVSQFRQSSATSARLVSARPLASGIDFSPSGAFLAPSFSHIIIGAIFEIVQSVQCGVQDFLITTEQIYPDIQEGFPRFRERIHPPRRAGLRHVPERGDETGSLQ